MLEYIGPSTLDWEEDDMHELAEKVYKNWNNWGLDRKYFLNKVIREWLGEKAKEIKHMHDHYEGHFNQDAQVSRILGLGEKKWCEHMEGIGRSWKASDDWKFCPICGKEKPNE